MSERSESREKIVRLADLAYPEVEALVQAGAIGLWPIGSTEAHGPHLPLGTDAIIAEETCRRAAPAILAKLQKRAVLFPTLTITITDFASPFPGTLSIPKETALAYVRDSAVAAASFGFQAVCLVNAHLEPAHRFMLRDAVKAAREKAKAPIALADPSDRRWAQKLTEEFAKGACHAGQYETSLVLAARPNEVRADAAARLEPLPIDILEKVRLGAKSFLEAGATSAYFGNPRGATSEEGEASYRVLVDIVCAVIEEALAASAADRNRP